ncbi:MAG: phosphonate metabolism transcriptional regulator PhnF [Pseudomonadota bacterium]
MARTPIWQTIKRSLITDIAEGRFTTGDRLPTEAQLSGRFGVNRHTVRRALSAMAEEGLVHSRRGSGVFVAASPTDYAIGRRVRFHQNIAASGRIPEKRVLSATTQSAGSPEAGALRIGAGDPVLVYDGLSLADGQPIALFQSMFPAERLPGLGAALHETASVTEALAACGVKDYTRISTRITAKEANATQALHLQVAEGAPLLRTDSLNADPDGTPVEFGRTWFAGDRVTLTVGED